MIKYPITFVLGAGVSCEVGYPLGIELRTQIIERTHGFIAKGKKYTPIDQQLIDSYGKDNLLQFHESLLKSGTPSIDDFLLIRKEFSEIGKYFIAETILRHEKEEMLYNPRADEKTYDRIFHKYIKSKEDLEKLFFVTFNYDLSLELYLNNFLTHLFGIQKKNDLENESQKIKIIHPHGKLGDIESRKYGNAALKDFEEISSLASEIYLMHEPKSEESYRQSRLILEDSKKVIFLGLHYHEYNISRLRLDEVVIDHTRYGTKIFLGSSYGLTPSEINYLTKSSYAKRITFGDTNLKNVEYLRNCDIFNFNIS